LGACFGNGLEVFWHEGKIPLVEKAGERSFHFAPGQSAGIKIFFQVFQSLLPLLSVPDALVCEPNPGVVEGTIFELGFG
jgi:hypothetical protein